MSLEAAIRATEILLALAFLQSSAEHLRIPADRRLFLVRFLLSALLLCGGVTAWVLLALTGHALAVLIRFGGPYNGGSDRMGMLILAMLTLSHHLPDDLAEMPIVYLAAQTLLSYFMAGWVKVINPDWRRGQALADVFRFSAYPVSKATRRWAERRRLLFLVSWLVMGLELLLPLTLLSPGLLVGALLLAAGFHLSNAIFLGLNRFVWVWIATYPSLFWVQAQILAG